MKLVKSASAWLFACLFLVSVMPVGLLAAEWPWPDYKTYAPMPNDVEKYKKRHNDPRPLMKNYGPKQILPKEMYAKLVFDQEKMKSTWSSCVGFKAPDVVGKIAPDIKPGKYTYKDVQANPGFKQLIPPNVYKRIGPSAPPFGGNIPEFEIVPTKQYYWSLPIAEATKRNEGKTKLDDKGYIIQGTWEGGYPFPKPSGKQKAQQIMQNVEKRALQFGADMYQTSVTFGYNKKLEQDYSSGYVVVQANLAGRVYAPVGWFDARAKEKGESKAIHLDFLSPRDMAGSAYSSLYYLDPNKNDQMMMYVSSMRRVRKMSSTDTQDPLPGADQCYDDQEGFTQRLSPTRYPYAYEVVEEKEFLIPCNTDDGSEYIATPSLEHRNVKFERRPMYVVKLKQLDKNYIYGQRIFYIDKETFLYYSIENYDQKGRLYRTWDNTLSWWPEMGMFSWTGNVILQRDHIDLHSTFYQPHTIPAFPTRSQLSLEGILKAK